VTLSVASGSLRITAGGAGGLTADQMTGNGTGVVVLRASVAAINNALAAGVTYLGNLNFNGTDTLSIIADDLGNAGAGGPQTDSDSVSISVLSPAAQINRLKDMVAALEEQGSINAGQNRSLVTKLERAGAALVEGKPKVAFAAIGAFTEQVRSFVALGVLAPTEGGALLTAVGLLFQSLQIGSA